MLPEKEAFADALHHLIEIARPGDNARLVYDILTASTVHRAQAPWMKDGKLSLTFQRNGSEILLSVCVTFVDGINLEFCHQTPMRIRFIAMSVMSGELETQPPHGHKVERTVTKDEDPRVTCVFVPLPLLARQSDPELAHAATQYRMTHVRPEIMSPVAARPMAPRPVGVSVTPNGPGLLRRGTPTHKPTIIGIPLPAQLPSPLRQPARSAAGPGSIKPTRTISLEQRPPSSVKIMGARIPSPLPPPLEHRPAFVAPSPPRTPPDAVSPEPPIPLSRKKPLHGSAAIPADDEELASSPTAG